MSEPMTKSGLDLLDDYLAPPYHRDSAAGWVIAIEREARAALLDELEAAVRDITERHARLHTCSTKKVHADLRSVLALIQQHREEGT